MLLKTVFFKYLRSVDGGIQRAGVHEGRVRQAVSKEEENRPELGEGLHLLHLSTVTTTIRTSERYERKEGRRGGRVRTMHVEALSQ